MRKISAFLSALLICAAAISPVFAEDDLRTGTASKGTPEIDGKIDEIWETTESYAVDRLKDGTDTGLTASFRSLWDENNLYVLIEVNDPDHSFNGGISIGDGIAVYFNPKNNTDAVSYEDDDTISYFEICSNDVANVAWSGSSVAQGMYMDNQVIEVVETDAGYTYEISMNLKEAADVTLAADMTMGFDIQVNDQNENSDVRTAAYGWNDSTNQAWESPLYFGQLTLIDGAAAETEAVTETAAESVAAEETTSAPAETETTTAPQTFDIGVMLAIAASAAGSAVVISRRKK